MVILHMSESSSWYLWLCKIWNEIMFTGQTFYIMEYFNAWDQINKEWLG